MKRRRDITLGEMQDECKKRETRCGLNSDNPCPYDKTCDAISPHGFSTDGNGRGAVFPCYWNLTVPPRFNEQQMAFWRGWYEIGCNNVLVGYNGNFIFDMKGNGAIVIEHYAAVKLGINLKVGETLDLAELLGKDGAEC